MLEIKKIDEREYEIRKHDWLVGLLIRDSMGDWAYTSRGTYYLEFEEMEEIFKLFLRVNV